MASAERLPLIGSPFPNVGKTSVARVEDDNFRHAENHKAIVGLDTGKLFSIFSKEYRLIRLEEVIAQVEEELARTRELGQYRVLTESFN